MVGGYINRWESFPAVYSSQLHIGQEHADNYDSQQSHLVLPEAPHRVINALLFQEQLPWDAVRQEKLSVFFCVGVCVGYCVLRSGYAAILTWCHCCRTTVLSIH